MRPIHLARLEKTQPAVILTRERALHAMTRITVAPITSTVRGLSTEVPVGPSNGLDHACVVSCDNVQSIHISELGRRVGYLLDDQEAELAAALVNASNLRVEDLEP
jgi:mRNA interferase MazF